MKILIDLITSRGGRIALQASVGLIAVLAAVLVGIDGSASTVVGAVLIALIGVLGVKLGLVAERRTAHHDDLIADLRARSERIGTALTTSVARLEGEQERLAGMAGSNGAALADLSERVRQLARRVDAVADEVSTARSDARALTARVDTAEDAIARRLPPDAQEAAVVVRQAGPALAGLAALHGEILEIHEEVERLRRQIGRAELPIERSDD